MTADLARAAIVAAAAGLALGTAWWLRRHAVRQGTPVDVAGLLAGAGVVVFTKDDCATCVTTLERLASLGVRTRQVRAEAEPDELDRRGVTGVPVTIVVDGSGRVRAQFAGVPKPGPLRRAVRRAQLLR